jgi:hypothetical protein
MSNRHKGFQVFVDRLFAKEASPGDDGGTFRWIVEDGEILGGIALRHESAPDVDVLGNGGYGLRPSKSRGLAAAAIREMLCLAKARSMNRVLLALPEARSSSAFRRSGSPSPGGARASAGTAPGRAGSGMASAASKT